MSTTPPISTSSTSKSVSRKSSKLKKRSKEKKTEKRNPHYAIRLEDQNCPRCHTSKHHDPSMVLHVGPCAHQICKLCLDAHFKNDAGDCPECGLHFRKKSFKPQYFDDPKVDREVDIRKMLAKNYTLSFEDFKSDEEYTSYLHEYEDLAFAIVAQDKPEESSKLLTAFREKYSEKLKKHKKTVDPVMKRIFELCDEDNRRKLQEKNERLKNQQQKSLKIDKFKMESAIMDSKMEIKIEPGEIKCEPGTVQPRQEDLSKYIYKPSKKEEKSKILRTKPMTDWKKYFPKDDDEADKFRSPGAVRYLGEFKNPSYPLKNLGKDLEQLCEMHRKVVDANFSLNKSCGYPIELSMIKTMMPMFENTRFARLADLRESLGEEKRPLQFRNEQKLDPQQIVNAGIKRKVPINLRQPLKIQKR